MSKLSVYPTRIEVYDDEIGNLVATVQQNDEVTVKVEIMQVIGWNDWLDITDAVRKAMHMMGMGEK
jgi:Skp family chaperone for outer membrane proteins